MQFGNSRVSRGQNNGHDRTTVNHTPVAGKEQQPSNPRWEHLVYPIHTDSQVKALVWYKRP